MQETEERRSGEGRGGNNSKENAKHLVQQKRGSGTQIPTAVVFIASCLRFLHCGRYPWLWNDEHALVMPTVVGIGLLFCVLAMG